MYRSGSFASSSQFSIRSSATSTVDKDSRLSQDDGRTLFLKSKGSLPLKTLAPITAGRIMTLCNYPVRNRQWNMEIKTHLMLAYEAGSHVIVDALTSDVVGSFQCPFNYGAVKMLAAHPREPLVAMVQGNYTLILWSIAQSQCTETLECPEVIQQCGFEAGGRFLFILLERGGLYIYHTQTLQMAIHIHTPLPHSVMCLGYACILHKDVYKHERVTKEYMHVLISTSNNRLLAAYVGVGAAKGDGESGLKCFSLVAFDLPSKMEGAVAICNVSSDEGDGEGSGGRVALLGRAGDLLLLEGGQVHETSP
eukprot:gene39655-48277_t